MEWDDALAATFALGLGAFTVYLFGGGYSRCLAGVSPPAQPPPFSVQVPHPRSPARQRPADGVVGQTRAGTRTETAHTSPPRTAQSARASATSGTRTRVARPSGGRARRLP